MELLDYLIGQAAAFCAKNPMRSISPPRICTPLYSEPHAYLAIGQMSDFSAVGQNGRKFNMTIVNFSNYRAISKARVAMRHLEERIRGTFDTLSSVDLLDVDPRGRQGAIKKMATAKMMLVMRHPEVKEALATRFDEIGGPVPTEECIAIARNLFPNAFTIRMV